MAIVVFVVVAVAVALVVDTQRPAHRAGAGGAGGGRSADRAAPTPCSARPTDARAAASSAVDMFGVRAAASSGRVRDGHAEVVAAVGDVAPRVPSPTDEDARRRDDEHDLVLAGAPLPRLRRGCSTRSPRTPARSSAPGPSQRAAGQVDRLARDDDRPGPRCSSAVSHDLRTPLAGIKAASAACASTDVHVLAGGRGRAARRPSRSRPTGSRRWSANLLDMSRLQTGAVSRTLPESTSARWCRPRSPAVAGRDRIEVDRGRRPRTCSPTRACSTGCWPTSARTRCGTAPAPAGCGSTPAARRTGSRLRVIDTGPGVPDDDQERIFAPFQRLGDVPPADGVGLGLAVARGLRRGDGWRRSPPRRPGRRAHHGRGAARRAAGAPTHRGDA